jgi:phage major head subunit gpT-like protein
MALISTGLLEKGLRSNFFERLGAVQTYWQDLCTRITSTSDAERYRWLGAMAQMRAWGTGRKATGALTETYNVANQKYEATIEVDRDELDDDQTGQIRQFIGEMADAAAVHKELLIEDLLNHGTTAGYVAYDGITFFNATHSSGASGNQTNLVSHAAATGTTPTSAEFRDAVVEARAAMASLLDDKGNPARIRTSGLVIACPTLLYQTALEAMTAPLLGGTSNVNVGLAKPIEMPGLTSGVKAFLLKTDASMRPFIFQDRMPIEFAALDSPTTDDGFKREKYLYGVRARYAMAYGKWQYAIEITFT